MAYARKDMTIEGFDTLYKEFADALKNIIKAYDLIVTEEILAKALDDIVIGKFNNYPICSSLCIGVIECIKDKKLYLIMQNEFNVEVILAPEYHKLGEEVDEDIVFRLFGKTKGTSKLGAGYDTCKLEDFLAGIYKYLKEEK